MCASVDVREHAPVRRLTHAHVSAAGSMASTVQVFKKKYKKLNEIRENKGIPTYVKNKFLILFRWKEKIIPTEFVI